VLNLVITVPIAEQDVEDDFLKVMKIDFLKFTYCGLTTAKKDSIISQKQK